MQIIYTPKAKEHLDFWVKSGNKSILKKILLLIQSVQQTPFDGIGKPEMLKHELSGLWSRRMNQEHRLVYEVRDGTIFIHSLKGHY
ncbi:Txe/YoeB family addiction module toxin [Dyadobacter pollutisoli]|jgi:toxin YoeB|uniref:Putative mRNA interferase YoeB n=1 Tax=Dyadobacter pollutisoli TaxID=2910158 RepID=A0A9E8NAM7_9BACT|nr:Txe/YoeB family addiction module toxin [Dyadobacter pollutisoli]WAC10869.1 Txe/YoeB family addiction module toxin [Dyadobacter pollutisoli]